MTKKYCSTLLSIVVFLITFGIRPEFVVSKEAEKEIGEVVTKHVKSIGASEILAGITIRGLSGTALVNFIQGGTGKMSGQALVVTDKNRLGVIMKYGANEYPGEHFAFDGNEVTVGHISPGQRSPVADFIYRYNGIMKEGLLGGVLSLNWPLLYADKNESRLKYIGKKKIEGTELDVIEYGFSNKAMNDVKVKLCFELETFRHVRTEYYVRVQGEMSLQADAVVVDGGMPSSGNLASGGRVRAGDIHDNVPDSIYRLVEKFGDFKEVDGMVLPHEYVLDYSLEGQGSSFLAQWTIIANQWMHTGKVDASFFTAP